MDFIPQMEPWFDNSEEEALANYMRTGGWVTEFKVTRQFEEQIAGFTKSRYCSVVSNGTVSLTLALMACGIRAGDEVIVPDYTMVASANAAILAGAEVVFVDIRSEDLCMDFNEMRRAVTPRTKAVILVTINGRYPSDLDSFVIFCKDNNIFLIEDAAQSLGSFKDGKHLGTFGDIGSFSFSAPKVITTGQGGALITNNDAIIDKIRKLRDFGRSEGGSDHYLTLGWNFKFTDVQAVIGVEQMKKLPWRIARKKEMYSLYRSKLQDIDELSFIPTNLNDTSPWFIDILVKNGKREKMSAYLKSRQIGTRPFYPALHKEPVFNREGSFPEADKIAGQGLWLPSSSKLTDEQIIYICTEIRNFLERS